jgi:hypothetical protein
MSRSSNESLNCPKCGKAQSVAVWSSLNIDLDPDLRTRLFNGEINQFKCQFCQHSAFINTPLMYHDMRRQFAVQYYPPESLDDPEFIASFDPTHPPRMKGLPKKIGYVGEPHIVFEMGDLLACIVFHERIRGKQ